MLWMRGGNDAVSHWHPRVVFASRIQIIQLRLERMSQYSQFRISHAPQLRLDFRERAAAQIPAKDVTSGGERLLCHFLLITQLSDLWANNVLGSAHAPFSELDRRGLSQ